MIDLHCHLPFALSDGPETEADALALLERAAAGGATYLNAVIHAGSGESELPRVVAALAGRAAELGVTLHPGVEYDGLNCLFAATSPLFTVGEKSPFVLVDMRSSRVPFQAPQQVSELSARGIRVVIVHPEVLFDPSQLPMLRRLADADAVMQLNAASLLPDAPAPVRGMARRCLEAGLCDLVASDAHRVDGHRRWCLDEAREAIRQQYGDAAATVLFETNPARLLAGRGPVAWRAPRKESKGWFAQLLTLFRRRS